MRFPSVLEWRPQPRPQMTSALLKKRMGRGFLVSAFLLFLPTLVVGCRTLNSLDEDRLMMTMMVVEKLSSDFFKSGGEVVCAKTFFVSSLLFVSRSAFHLFRVKWVWLISTRLLEWNRRFVMRRSSDMRMNRPRLVLPAIQIPMYCTTNNDGTRQLTPNRVTWQDTFK